MISPFCETKNNQSNFFRRLAFKEKKQKSLTLLLNLLLFLTNTFSITYKKLKIRYFYDHMNYININIICSESIRILSRQMINLKINILRTRKKFFKPHRFSLSFSLTSDFLLFSVEFIFVCFLVK